MEDTALPEQNKRWVVIKPANGNVDTPATEIVLAQAQDAQQQAVVGQQGGGRVMFFLYTNDFWRDFERYSAAGVIFHEQPREEGYGTVAVFQDLYGNLWDLLQPK